MVPLNSPELIRISKFLEKYDQKSTVKQLSGLLTAPTLQANTVRIETLVHLSVMFCHGNRKPGLPEIRNWLNRYLGKTFTASLEDPVEDVFITNVETPEGNRRVFEGLWESNDYYVQVVLETLGSRSAPKECQNLRTAAFALLRLSDCVAERNGLKRWHIEPSVPKGTVRVSPSLNLSERARWVTFTQDDLESLGLTREVLSPFIFRSEDKQSLVGELTGHSSLEKRPLIDFNGELVLTLPHSVSPAIRRFVMSELRQMGYLQFFEKALSNHQARQVEKDGLRELKNKAESLTPPKPDDQIPSCHTWLLKYDLNMYLHVVMLHDKLDCLESQGLASFMDYPEMYRIGLEKYLIKVANYCRVLPDFVEGMTLLVLGGLGRAIAVGFNEWPNQWRLSLIKISDLLTLAGELGQPITQYLKCIKQRDWANENGVYYQNINGDYNFYCYWRRMNYQIVPRDLKVAEGSMVCIVNDMVLTIREEVRNLVDRHVIQTTTGFNLPVTRFGRDAYFKSMKSRPIYASLDHFRSGVLAGAVETSRGPSWLIVMPRESDEKGRNLLYSMWSGFIGLYDRLVFEVEAVYPDAISGAIEIRLNFNELVVFEDYIEPQPNTVIGEPKVEIHLDQRTVEIKFPWDFLMHFQKPENTGERLVLIALANGLACLHQGATGGMDESVLNKLINRVIGDSGTRVLHLFKTHYPIEHLLSTQTQTPIFLAHEDFVFSKLRLAEGCTTANIGTGITSKHECNTILHKIVDKIWNQIKSQLRTLDRASVISEVLRLHESIIQDRVHWRWTAQAVLSLYGSVENVFLVAQEREKDRANISLSARTILEMAICECPTVDGLELSRWKLDELLAKVVLLIEVATDSDAVNSDLVDSKIQLYPNGEYAINRGFHDTVIKPFLTAYFNEGFEEAAGEYNDLYQNDRLSIRRRADEIFSADFIRAFQAEFGLTPDEAVNGLSVLMDLAVENKNVVVETTLGNIKKRLTMERGLSPDVSDAFIRTFSIFHRPNWDKPPLGFKKNDINPWRFRRRLSATARPILVFGDKEDDKVFFGAGSLRLGFRYLLARSEQGHLPTEFFISSLMKKYIGAVNDERGHEFARKVAKQMHDNGWEVRNEVQMTELGAPTELGDVDVLAWKANGDIQIIECKRLQLVRTVAEVAEICRRFRGEAKDDLDRHVQRVNWIKANPKCLQNIVGFEPVPECIDYRLITNTHVPMMYLTTLPINPLKIGPLR